jgi:ParB family chromosome partitioning protein
MARRLPSPVELLNEIQRLKAQGYNNSDIGRKLDIDRPTIIGLIALKKAGEERLLEAALNGKVPLGVAIDIAKTDGAETQRTLLKAYEKKQLNQASIRDIKKLMEQRRFIGKQRGSGGRGSRKNRPSAENLVSVYRRESEKRKVLVRKARICEERLFFVVTAFSKLMSNDHFVTLLRAESLATMPKVLGEKVAKQQKEGI